MAKNEQTQVKIFGRVDREGKRLDGRILSEYPAWYFDPQIEQMQETIEEMKRQEKAHEIPYEQLGEHKVRREKYEERLSMILESKPKLNAVKRKQAETYYRELGNRIKDSMPSRSDMMLGRASAKKEADKMTKHTENVDPAIAHECGVQLVNGKATMSDVTRIWKIMGKMIGAETNAETLRRDHATGTFKLPVSMAEAERS